MYLHISQCIKLSGDINMIVLKLKKNLYGLRDAGCMWYGYLSEDLIEMGLIRLKHISMYL